MGLVNRWTALFTLAAGAATAAGVSRRLQQPGRRVPRMAGVDGLGEPFGGEAPEATSGGDAAIAHPASGQASPDVDAPAGDDPIAALDSARDRLRRQAEDLRREIGTD